jgi:hypothetical protein
MSPDRKARQKAKPKAARVAGRPVARMKPSSDDAHEIVYFKRHRDDDATESAPGRDFLEGGDIPKKVKATMKAVLVAVAVAPPKRFSGGGYWEAMKDEMTGWFEVRVDGPDRRHYRLFCRLDYEATNRDKPLLVVVAGMSKPFKTTFSDADYADVRALGDEYLARNPRSVF